MRAEHHLVPKGSFNDYYTLKDAQKSHEISPSQWSGFVRMYLEFLRGMTEELEQYCNDKHIQKIYDCQDSMFYEWDSDDYNE